MAELKVFRLPIGFHDAYVAAPSQKAAIEAWGSDKDVFTRKQAELVMDPALTEEPLANPGQIIKRLRGTAAEQIAALGEPKPPESRKSAKVNTKVTPKKPRPPPSRAALDEAEAAVAEAEARHAAEMKALREREAALARERKALEAKQRDKRKRLEARQEKEGAAHDAAMRKWRG